MKFKIFKIYKIIVGLSGGVDSSVSAWILKNLGYKIKCVFIKCWDEKNKKLCTNKKDYKDALNICKKLKIKIIIIDFSYEYMNKVFIPFIKELKNNKTPNPDILCNKEIKFKLFINFSINILNSDYISTGHYVKKIRLKNKFLLLKGKDKKKDQSYFLYNIKQKQIKRCLFPLGDYKKKQVRKIAKNINLINANKKDSTGICFIGKRKFKDFIIKYIKKKPGKILDNYNNILGTHKGLFLYTIGQRKNLLLGNKGYHNPWYVIKKKHKENYLIVTDNINNINLYSIGILIKKIHYILYPKFKNSSKIKCKIKIRSQQKEIICTIYPKKIDIHKIIFKKPIFGVTPGQSAVFYLRNICIGGGIIYKNIFLKK